MPIYPETEALRRGLEAFVKRTGMDQIDAHEKAKFLDKKEAVSGQADDEFLAGPARKMKLAKLLSYNFNWLAGLVGVTPSLNTDQEKMQLFSDFLMVFFVKDDHTESLKKVKHAERLNTDILRLLRGEPLEVVAPLTDKFYQKHGVPSYFAAWVDIRRRLVALGEDTDIFISSMTKQFQTTIKEIEEKQAAKGPFPSQDHYRKFRTISLGLRVTTAFLDILLRNPNFSRNFSVRGTPSVPMPPVSEPSLPVVSHSVSAHVPSPSSLPVGTAGEPDGLSGSYVSTSSARYSGLNQDFSELQETLDLKVVRDNDAVSLEKELRDSLTAAGVKEVEEVIDRLLGRGKVDTRSADVTLPFDMDESLEAKPKISDWAEVGPNTLLTELDPSLLKQLPLNWVLIRAYHDGKSVRQALESVLKDSKAGLDDIQRSFDRLFHGVSRSGEGLSSDQECLLVRFLFVYANAAWSVGSGRYVKDQKPMGFTDWLAHMKIPVPGTAV
ncbi:MAG: hypothetical protein AB7F28_07680 [Candidatus Margulisiibacteriota bacterium]